MTPSGALDWPALRELLRAGDPTAVAEALLALDEPQRRLLAVPLNEYRVEPVDPVGVSSPLSYDPQQWQRQQQLRHGREDALRVAGVGCLPRANNIVAWLRSDRFWSDGSPQTADLVARLLAEPDRPSLAAVARGLATRLRLIRVRRDMALVIALLRAAELPPPLTDAIVRGWTRHLDTRSYTTDQLVERLRDDPWLPILLPQVFDLPGVGADLGGRWPPALARLCADAHGGTRLPAIWLPAAHAGRRPAQGASSVHRPLPPP